MKRIFSMIFALAFCMGMIAPAYATETNEVNIESLVYETEVGETSTMTVDGMIYEYTCYSEPVDYAYDGTTCTLLGTLSIRSANPATARGYYETTLYEVVDYGIISRFINRVGPYFIDSVAKGETISQSATQTASLSAQFDTSLPSASKSVVLSSLKGQFTLQGTTTYTRTFTITLEGPDENSSANTRSYYYNKAYHKHSINVKEHLYSSWGGILATTTYSGVGYEPVIEHFSEDYTV